MKSNPLATRFVAPGRLAWRPSAGASLAELLARFTGQLNARAAIVGPHGSGKSTFLENFVPLVGILELRAAAFEQDGGQLVGSPTTARTANAAPRDERSIVGRRIVWLTLRGRTASRRLVFQTYRTWADRNCVLVIDGYEQLSPVARGATLLLTRISGAGILVTSHKTTALPTLVETRVGVPLAQELLDQLLPDELEGRARFLDADRVRQLLDKHQGNLREVFMELYDEL